MNHNTPATIITAWAIPTDPPVLFSDRQRAIDYAVQHRTAAPVKLTQCGWHDDDPTPAPPTYAYSTDGGETYQGCHDSRAAAISAALDDLASDTEPGTYVEIHTCRRVPCQELLQRSQHIGRHLASAAEETLSDWLYGEIGDEQPMRPLSDAEHTALGHYILRGFARLDAFRGCGLGDEQRTEEVARAQGGAA